MKKYPYPVIDMEATGRNISERRKKAGYSVKDLSEEFDFTGPQAVYNWQHGESLPTIENLILLAKLFDANVEDLVCLKNEKEMEAGDSRSPLILNVHFFYLLFQLPFPVTVF